MVPGASVAEEARTENGGVGADLLVRSAFAAVPEVFNLPPAESVAATYQAAAPYPNLVIEGFFKRELFQALQCELVAGARNFNQVFTDEFKKNKTISTGDSVPPLISLLAAKFAAPQMLRYLERVTGLQRLVPDPYYNTDYGYYHIVGAGGVLGSHVDHARHSALGLPHVLNIVVYLTEGWNPEDGGALCLYDANGREVVKRIDCVANRAVLFACTPTAYHGVEPIAERSGGRRHSLYFAYYAVDGVTVSGPEAFPSSQGAASNSDAAANYSTFFVVPFTQLFRPQNWIHLRTRLIYLANLCLPPIAVRLVRKIVRALR
jgi:hypothetical protein